MLFAPSQTFTPHLFSSSQNQYRRPIRVTVRLVARPQQLVTERRTLEQRPPATEATAQVLRPPATAPVLPWQTRVAMALTGEVPLPKAAKTGATGLTKRNLSDVSGLDSGQMGSMRSGWNELNKWLAGGFVVSFWNVFASNRYRWSCLSFRWFSTLEKCFLLLRVIGYHENGPKRSF